MSNDISSALSELDDAITAATDWDGATSWDTVRAHVAAARDHVTDVPVLVDFANAWLDGEGQEPDSGATADYGTHTTGGRETVVTKSRGGIRTSTLDVDDAHALRVLRGRFALNDGGSPVFGAQGT